MPEWNTWTMMIHKNIGNLQTTGGHSAHHYWWTSMGSVKCDRCCWKDMLCPHPSSLGSWKIDEMLLLHYGQNMSFLPLQCHLMGQNDPTSSVLSHLIILSVITFLHVLRNAGMQEAAAGISWAKGTKNTGVFSLSQSKQMFTLFQVLKTSYEIL